MALADELDNLENWIQRLPRIGMETMGGAGASIRVLDFVFIGAIKRSVSLSSGLRAMNGSGSAHESLQQTHV